MPPPTHAPHRPSPPPTTDDDLVPEQPTEDLPLSMTTSLILTQLPRDATTALAAIDALDADAKVTVRFQALPGAPEPGRKWIAVKVRASQNFGSVVQFLRTKLGLATKGEGGQGGQGSLFCYVNKVFAPGLDEGMGNLMRCFSEGGELKVSYALTPAFG